MFYGLYVEKSEKLGKFDIPGKGSQIIHNIYWKQTTFMWIENEYTKTERDLFNLCSKMIVR